MAFRMNMWFLDSGNDDGCLGLPGYGAVYSDQVLYSKKIVLITTA